MQLLDASGAKALRESGARALLLGVGLAAFELGVRTMFGAASPPNVGTALLDVGAHLGRVAILVPPLAVADLAFTTVASTKPGAAAAEALSRSARRLARPARVLRLLAAAGIAWPIAARTVGRYSQMPLLVGALCGAAVAGVVAIIELSIAAVRKEPPTARVHLAGAALLAIAYGLFATAVVPFLDAGAASAAVDAAVALIFARAIVTFERVRPRGRFVALGFAAAGALLVLDARRPELRRFESAYTPFSSLGLHLAQAATDFDGDGASGLLGLDCNDGDRDVGPTAPDLPDDGVDQNCRGGDGKLARALARYAPGGVHAPSPAPGLGPQRRPPIFLVSVDAWRADAFDASLFPRTSAWADRCVRFSNVRATAPATGASLVSLHTGVFTRHVVFDNRWLMQRASPERKIMSTPPTLAAALAIVGDYRTTVVFPPFHSTNVEFLTGYEAGGSLPDTGTGAFPSAAQAFETAQREIAQAPRAQPIHLRVHLMDLHTPYRGNGASGRAAYLDGARALDAPLADFLGSLPPDAIVVLTADHGEAFGEHGYTEHGHTLFDEELRVPLVLCAPGADLGPPRTVDTPISLVDVTPTLFELTGVDVPYRRHGESLVPLLRGGTRRTPWVFAENDTDDHHQVALVRGCDKWIEDLRVGWTALFDLCADPHERHDRAREDPARASEMRSLLTEVIDLDLDAFRSWRVGTRVLR